MAAQMPQLDAPRPEPIVVDDAMDESSVKTPTRDSFARQDAPATPTPARPEPDLQGGQETKDGDELASNTAKDGSEQDSGEGDGRPSKKKKGQRFFCTEYPPCILSFTRSEHLARHIRYVYTHATIYD